MSWGKGFEHGVILKMDENLISRAGSYSGEELEALKKAQFIMPYQHGGDCFTYCLVVKKTKTGWKGTDVEKYSFGFYNTNAEAVKKCSMKERYRLLAGLSIKD